MGKRYSKETPGALALLLVGLIGGCDVAPVKESAERPPMQQSARSPATSASQRTEALAPFGESPEPETRRWSDNTGRFSAAAKFTRFTNDKVTLTKADNKTVEVPLDRLSEADRRYVDSVAVKTISGKVVALSDGDTITVQQGKTFYKIRLEGIDAPEGAQAFGVQAKKALIEKLLQKDVQIQWKGKDERNRVLGHVYVDGRWINKELIEEGVAWHYKQYNNSTALAQAETEARARRRGLWSDSNPVAPWEYRRKPVKPSVENVATPPPSSSHVRSENDKIKGGSVEVRGYYRKDGTYVKPHTRKSPQR
jgi:endonuclease YncB( thermonuclease family)